VNPLVIPEDLTALSDEELAALAAEATERAEALNDPEHAETAELSGDAAVALINDVLAADEKITAELASRAEAKAENDRILAETRERLAARLNPPDPADPAADPADPAAGDPPAADPVPAEPITAGATRNTALTRAAARRRATENEPNSPAASDMGPKIRALKGLPGVFEHGENVTLKQVAQLATDSWNRSHTTDGPAQDMPLARIVIDTPDERVLREGDEIGNFTKIQNVVGHQALVASGGLCAPVEPYYDLQLLATEVTPVIDSLPRFGAERGGIRFMTPPTLASVTTGVGVKTAANDALGGTNATKTCQTIPCPAQTQVVIQAIYHCLTFGNMGARTWPELVEQFTGLTMASHARVRETAALDAIAASSTAVTAGAIGGAVNTLLAQVIVAADGLRGRHRMSPDAIFRGIFPFWTLGLLLTDLIRGQFDRFSRDKQGVSAMLRELAGVEATFYMDGPTGGGQVLGAQSTGALNNYPANVRWYLFPEGSWIRLDGGELDIGLVRDSVLNATNDFQMFGEVFEAFAMIGVESLAINSTAVCASGAVTEPSAAPSCPISY
jgi:hypothetical protein